MEMYINALAWVGNALLIAGIWGVGNKVRSAFLLSVAGETAWIAYGLARGDWAITFISVVFGAILIRNWFKWRDQ